jgi:NADH/NAD ratio-sensing transcriptional regulator Rex
VEHLNERGYADGGTFTIESDVVVVIAITADLDQRLIRMNTKNLGPLGESTYGYGVDEFNEALWEELARMILDKPNDFRTMGRLQRALSSSRDSRPQP